MESFKVYSNSERKEKRENILSKYSRVVKTVLCDTPCSTPCDTPCSTPCDTPCG
jgi:hypothetical protein